jgi:4-diphosphocytidyl-2-C-methyl-D-erythritol kinase
LLQTVGLFDELDITTATRDEIDCDWPDLPAENTVSKALRLLRELVPVRPLHITIHKRIPAQSGLGGGSSDAAGLIRAVQRMYPDYTSDQFAHEVAVAVGSDVPFFLVGGLARATGYGEKVDPLPDAPTKWLLIVKPDESVSTGAAYLQLDGSPREWSEFMNELYNDFERVAPSVCCEIAQRLQVHGALGAQLCGSGSAVFGLFDTEDDAQSAMSRIASEGFETAWVTRTLMREESLWTS